MARNSLKEGKKWSRLPKMSKSLQVYIKGTADFLGLNYYTGISVSKASNKSEMTGFRKDIGLSFQILPSWNGTTAQSVWLSLVPGGIRKCLNWIKDNYNNVPVWITENGWSDDGTTLDDINRIKYLKVNYADVAKAISIDGCNVKGHTAWSLIDNFEWLQGYR